MASVASTDQDRDFDRLRLLASALAGRTLDVASGEPGALSWTDGSTVFLDPSAVPAEQIRMLGVQACLVAAGSLDSEVLGQLTRRPSLTRRYLAVEAHRALAANDHVLPPSLRSLVDDAVARGSASAADSLATARNVPADDLPATFGTIHPRRALTVAERAQEPRPRRPPRSGVERRRASSKSWTKTTIPPGTSGSCCRARSAVAARSVGSWHGCSARRGIVAAVVRPEPTPRPASRARRASVGNPPAPAGRRVHSTGRRRRRPAVSSIPSGTSIDAATATTGARSWRATHPRDRGHLRHARRPRVASRRSLDSAST